ncbi:MAG TPA: zinc-binding alcohol dehydrogenase family protein [Candidatus Aquilonibacter sp.]
MKALQIDRTGSLDALIVRDLPDPKRTESEAVIRVDAAGVNPSDVGIVMGRFPQLTLPRVLGRDFAGEVIDGPKDLIGRQVWGTGGGELGLTRDGAHAQMLLMPIDALAPRPPHLSPEGAAVIGTPMLTAWSAVSDLARTQPGEWVIVSGAAGAVGIAAVQIVKALGAYPIAIVRNTDDVSALEALGARAVVHSGSDDLLAVTRELTNGKGANVALNAIGAPVYAALVDALAKNGRMVIFSAAAGKDVTLDLFTFYRKRLTFYGLDTAALTLEEVAEVLKRVNPYVESGAIQPPTIAERYPLGRAPDAYARVQAGAKGKILITP